MSNIRCVCNLLNSSIFSAVGKCEALNIPLCTGLSYNTTRFPNLVKHRTQDEAALEVHQFFPLVKVGCSPDLATLLCSVYAPPCSGPRKPCRELCNRARSGCLPFMKRYGFNWPESLACEKFPAGGSGKLCFDRPNVHAETTQPPLPTTSEANGEYLSLCSATTMYFPPNSW